MKLTTFSLTALAGCISAQYAGIGDANDLYADYPSNWIMKPDTAGNGALWLGDAAIFIDGPFIDEMIKMPMYYGGFGMRGHDDPNQHAIPDANGNVYSMERYILKTANVKIGQINIYNNNIISFSAVNDNIHSAKLQIVHDRNGAPVMGDFRDSTSHINTCHFKMKADKLYDLSAASFQCGTANMDCDGDTPQRGWGSRKGNAIKNTFWMKFDPLQADLDLLSIPSYTTSCNGGANEDEFFCEYDPNYYGDAWVPSAAEECLF